jgi:hypothetical protein
VNCTLGTMLRVILKILRVWEECLPHVELGTMLRVILKILRVWEECLPHVEFAYNQATHSTTYVNPFQVVYGFNPIILIDILLLPTSERIHNDAKQSADCILKMHETTTLNIEKMNETYRDDVVKVERKLNLKQVIYCG